MWTLSRPEVKNALDRAAFAALAAAVRAAASDRELRAIVLTADGDAFVSGGDLRELRSATGRTDAAALVDAGRRVCDGLGRLAVPVIAALPGPAIGGGAELAMACDLRVADPRAIISFRHARMAVTTGWGILPKLVATVGHGAASRLLLAGHEVDAAEALRLGLVDGISATGECAATALAWARDVSRASPGAVARLKTLLRGTLGAAKGHRARERASFVGAWTGADHQEAVESFFARRAPRWKPR